MSIEEAKAAYLVAEAIWEETRLKFNAKQATYQETQDSYLAFAEAHKALWMARQEQATLQDVQP